MNELIVTRGGRETVYELIEDFVVIGSGLKDGIKIAGAGVQPQHCKVVKIEDGYRIVDMSGHGVEVSGSQVIDQALKDGDEIVVGDARIRFRHGAGAAPATPAAPARAAAPPRREGVQRRATAGPARSVGTRPRAGASAPRARPVAGAQDGGLDDAEAELPRRGKKRMPPHVIVGISLISTIIIFWIGLHFYQSMNVDSSDMAQQKQLDRLISQGKKDEAMRLIDSIPEGSPNFAYARDRKRELRNPTPTIEKMSKLSAGDNVFETRILDFRDMKVETDDPAHKGKPGRVRYFVKRIQRWMEEFPGHAKTAEAQALLAKYQPMVPSSPPTLEELVFEADMEAAERNFGTAIGILDQWLAANASGDTNDYVATKKKRIAIHTDARVWLKTLDEASLEMVDRGEYTKAMANYVNAAKKLKGIVDLENGPANRIAMIDEKIAAGGDAAKPAAEDKPPSGN